MYDALLDELDDDSASRVDDAIEDLADYRVLDFDDSDDVLVLDVPELAADLDLELDVATSMVYWRGSRTTTPPGRTTRCGCT